MEWWSFATAKAFAEHLCFLYPGKGLPVIVVRPFSVYGPRCRSGVVAGYVRQALRGEPITVGGERQQKGSLIYVTDVATGMLLYWLEGGKMPRARFSTWAALWR